MKLFALTIIGLLAAGLGFAEPFTNAVVVQKHTPYQFHELIRKEKERHLEQIKSYLAGNQESQLRFEVRQYPTLEEWIEMRKEIKEGDEIWEYRYGKNGVVSDSPNKEVNHAFSLVRDGKEVMTIKVSLVLMSWKI